MTAEQLIGSIETYNREIFPAQFILFIAVVIAFILVFLNSRFKNMIVSIILGSIWLWAGIVYFIMIFSRYSTLGYSIGGLSILQGIFFYYEALYRKKLIFLFNHSSREIVGYALILTGLVVYPLIEILEGRNIPEITSMGVPTSTTIITFGFLLFTDQGSPVYLLVIPSLLVLIGFTLSLRVGMYEEIITVLAGIITDTWLLRRRRYDSAKRAPLD